MGGYHQTSIGRTVGVDDDVQAAAARYLNRTGNDDLLDVLGLLDAPVKPQACPACGKPPPWSGVCRRTKLCRAGEEVA